MNRLLSNSYLITLLLAAAAASSAAEDPVKVFILSGQSNMQGHGRIAMGKDGDLDYAARQEPFSYLKKDGQWVERDDVWYYHLSGKGVETACNLKPGLGADNKRFKTVGPELTFG